MVHEPQVADVADISRIAARKPLRIVVLEDNPAEARLLKEMLIDVATEMTCEFAGELWEVSQELLDAADCAVVDLGLPDSSGLEALDWIRDLAPDVPIVVLTGIEDQATGVAALQHGAQEYLVKQHSNSFSIASAIRFAVVRMDIQQSLDRQNANKATLESSLLQELLALGLAMQTTQGWMRQPTVSGRMAEHVSAISALTEKLREPQSNPF
ncbi:MAG: response regulator [Nakamurella sp.]